MPLNGNGSFSPPAPQFPAIQNTIIYADDFNQIILDIATALSTAIFRDGQAAFTANQSMGTFKLINLGNGTNPQDAVTFLQVFTSPTFQDPTLAGSLVTITATTVNASGVTTLTLPAGTSIGNVSATELGYLDGVTSAIQTQLNGKVNALNGTAENLTLSGVPTAPTAAVGTNTNQVATMAALIAQAFSATLPLQTGNVGKFLTTDGTIPSWVTIPPPSITRSARTSNTILEANDSSKLIDITSGTFSQTFNAAATLGNGWYAYIGNSGTGFVTLDPNASETITVNGVARTTWVLWPREMGVVICNGSGFYYYCLQKGEIAQNASGVASVAFSTGIAYRRRLSLSLEDVVMGTNATYPILRINTVDSDRFDGFSVNGSTLNGATGTSVNLSPGYAMSNAATGASRLYSAIDIFPGLTGTLASIRSHFADTNSAYNSGWVEAVWASVTESTITEIKIATSAGNISGKFILREL